jgi:hypothetical protein
MTNGTTPIKSVPSVHAELELEELFSVLHLYTSADWRSCGYAGGSVTFPAEVEVMGEYEGDERVHIALFDYGNWRLVSGALPLSKVVRV